MNQSTICSGAAAPMLAASVLGAALFGFSGQSLAATTAEGQPSTVTSNAPPPAAGPSAQQCMNDLRVLDAQMQGDGNWMHGSGFGYGYPTYGYGYGYEYGHGYGYGVHGALTHHGEGSPNGLSRGRPGYEIRTLIASATILAERGKEQECNSLLSETRELYKAYAADTRGPNVAWVDGSAWRRKQIATAMPVAGSKAAFRSDELIGADVVNPQGDDLGDVYDVVMNTQTGKITYLVVGRGGVFGIGERHIPVPWEAFKLTAASDMIVLDTTKSNLDAAPRVPENHFSPSGNVGQQAQAADAFWKTRILK
jgi:sporulation protein YlmC with PRC-barrel domain